MDDDWNSCVVEKTKNEEFEEFDDDDDVDEKQCTNEEEYDDDDDVDEKQCTVERPNKIKQSPHHSNLKRDTSPCGKQETNKTRGELKRNAQIQAVWDCQGHRISSSSHIIANSGPGRAPISLERKGYRDNVQQNSDLNRNQTKPDSIPLQNKSKSPDNASVRVKLEAAKKRHTEGYRRVEKAKKQRMVQVVELQDLPKQDPKLFHGRPVLQHHPLRFNIRR